MTAATVATVARMRVDRIKVAVEATWQLVAESYQSRDWEALGYATWDEMCTREFGSSRLRLPREDRQEVVASLRESGLSLRAISAATGDSVTTVRRELSGVPNGTPEPVVVVDMETGEVLEDVAPLTQAEREALDPDPQPAPKITGIDGKTYTPSPKPKSRTPYRKPLPDLARDAGFEIRKATERIERIVSDDRYRQNEKQVATALRGHLLYVAETVAAVLDQLP